MFAIGFWACYLIAAAVTGCEAARRMRIMSEQAIGVA
jgi:hypothetical protein